AEPVASLKAARRAPNLHVEEPGSKRHEENQKRAAARAAGDRHGTARGGGLRHPGKNQRCRLSRGAEGAAAGGPRRYGRRSARQRSGRQAASQGGRADDLVSVSDKDSYRKFSISCSRPVNVTVRSPTRRSWTWGCGVTTKLRPLGCAARNAWSPRTS